MKSLMDTYLFALENKYNSNRPKRLLSLDSVGILGNISLEILKKIETDLSLATGKGKDFRLPVTRSCKKRAVIKQLIRFVSDSSAFHLTP